MEEQESDDKKVSRGRETVFRATYQNQSNLIQIADNKASMIISINTMIISSIIAISGYGAIAGKIESYGAAVTVPISLIVISSLISVVLSIQAARPKLIRKNEKSDANEKSSLLFFGVIAQYTQADYLKEMDRLLQSRKELYENMTIDLYNQGLILKRKYDLLTYAYQTFMIGFIFSVIVFLGFFAFG